MGGNAENRKVADGWLNSFNNKDVSTLQLAEDFVHTSPFGAILGKEVYLELVNANKEAFFSKTIDVVDVFDCGDKFVYRYVVGDMAACDCVYIRNGQISKIYSYYHFGEKPSSLQ